MKTSSWAAVIAALLLCAAPAGAFHTIFDYSVDRFELSGNRSWVVPLVVEFTTDTYGWYTSYGTSSFTDGRLHLHNPGTHVPGPDGTTLDLTEVAYTGGFVAQGLGDFV